MSEEEDAASLKEAWLEKQKVEWEQNQRLRQQRASVANMPGVAKGTAPTMPTEAEVKRDWLRRKRLEHEARLRRMEAQQQPPPNLPPVAPDEAAMKREWLRRKRLEHEAALHKRCAGLGAHVSSAVAPSEPDDAAMKRAWLQRKRQEHERSLAARGALAATEGTEHAPCVDASLLSSMSPGRHSMCSSSQPGVGGGGATGGAERSAERERYMQQLHDEKSQAQRERRRMSSDALRRPSLPPSLDGEEQAQEDLKQELLALSNLDDEQYAYYFNYAEKYDDEKDDYHSRMRGDLSGQTSAAGSSRSNTTAGPERVELADGLDDLELSFSRALESIESHSHDHGHQPPASPVLARSPTGSNSRYPLSFGSSPGVLPPARRHSVGQGQGSFRRGAHDDIGNAIDRPALLAASPGSGSASFHDRGSSSRAVGGRGADGVSWGVMGGGTRGYARAPPPPPLQHAGAEDDRLSRGSSRGSPQPQEAWIDAGSGSSTGSHSPLRFSPTPGSPRASEVLRLEDITVLRRR